MPLLAPVDLRCESLAEPLGIDTPKPRLSWLPASPERGERQTGYAVLVSSARELSEKAIGDFWDSGEVDSERTVQVEYRGDPLLSGTRYFWRVRWRNRSGDW